MNLRYMRGVLASRDMTVHIRLCLLQTYLLQLPGIIFKDFWLGKVAGVESDSYYRRFVHGT